MTLLTRRALMLFLCLVVVSAWAAKALAHRRSGLTAVRPDPPPVTQPTSKAEVPPESLPLKSESYWNRLLAQEQAKDFPEAWKTGLALVNLFPQAPQRGAALLKLAELAKSQGKTTEALELFGLVVFLDPGAPEAAQARMAASALEFVRDVNQSNPIQTMSFFLGKISGLDSRCQPDVLQEALRTGWQAVARQVRATSPLPLHLVEELLILWDAQPQEFRPPEGGLLLADILKSSGLLEEAQALQAQAHEKSRTSQQLLAKLHNFPDTLNQIPQGEGQNCYYRFWLPPWQIGFNSTVSPGEALLNWFLPHRANAAWPTGPAPALEQCLLYSLPPSLPKSTHRQKSMDKPGDREHIPFFQDRLGLHHLQEGQPEAAQATFQEMAQHHDPFWQRLAQVRLADLELSRLQTEPVP